MKIWSALASSPTQKGRAIYFSCPNACVARRIASDASAPPWARRLDQLDSSRENEGGREQYPDPPTSSSNASWTCRSRLVWEARPPRAHQALVVPSTLTITDCEVDLRPGGVFRSVMRSPEGQEFSMSAAWRSCTSAAAGLDKSRLPACSSAKSRSSRRSCTSMRKTAVRRYALLPLHRDEAGRSTKRWASVALGRRSPTSSWNIKTSMV